MSPAECCASTLPPPPDLPGQCSCCGAVLSRDEWDLLPFLGDQEDGEGGWLELRNHDCGSTIARQR